MNREFTLCKAIRCIAITLAVVMAAVLLPAQAQGQCVPGNHGVGIDKQCISPRNRCATDADCADANLCNGTEQCATEGAAGSNIVDCTITLTNPTTHCDDLTVTQAMDTIQNGMGSPLSSSDILISGTTGGTSGTCAVGTNLGGATTCTLDPGASVSFRSNFYVVIPADPNPLNDQAEITVMDTCDNSPTGCNTNANGVQFSAATDTQSGCSAGTPLNCDDGLFCTDDSCVPATGCAHAAHVCADTDICTDDSCSEKADRCVFAFDDTNDPSCAPAPGRMTGGGSVFTSGKVRVTHGFELHCDHEIGPNNLEVNWEGNHFHLEDLTSAFCFDDPSIEPHPPGADFDTYVGQGTGRCNGEPGATITFTLTDAGEPGKDDTATIDIAGCPDGLTLSVSNNLKKGNQQAH